MSDQWYPKVPKFVSFCFNWVFSYVWFETNNSNSFWESFGSTLTFTWSEYQNFLFLLLSVCDHPPKIFLCCLENTSKHLKLLYPGYLGMYPWLCTKQLSWFFVRSSNQSSKPAKLPVTPSTATLTKSQKNKNKTKKKPVENKTTKQTSPVKNASPPTVSSSQVHVWHVDLWRTAHSDEFCDQPVRVEEGGVRGA